MAATTDLKFVAERRPGSSPGGGTDGGVGNWQTRDT